MNKSKKVNMWFNASQKKCFIFKEGSSRIFDSVVRIDPNGVLELEYFLDEDTNDNWKQIKKEFGAIMQKYFKSEKHILVLNDIIKKANKDQWIYEFEYYAKLADNKNIPTAEEMMTMTKEIEDIEKKNNKKI